MIIFHFSLSFFSVFNVFVIDVIDVTVALSLTCALGSGVENDRTLIYSAQPLFPQSLKSNYGN